MTGIGVAAVLFALIFLGLLVRVLSSPGSGQSGAPVSGRDGARKVRDDFDQRARSTALAENPPGSSSMRNPKARGSTSA